MARSEGKRPEPRKRVPAKPAPKRPNLPAAEVEQKSSGLGKKVLIAGVGLAVLAGLTALSLGLANETDPAESLPAVTVEVSGDLLPPFADPSNDAAVGLVAPEITSVDFAGAPAAISNDGTPKMILFLAHWCLHCQREVPVLQSWIEENGLPSGVDFVSVATSIDETRSKYPPNAWLEGEGWTQRVVMDDAQNSISAAYGLVSFPYYVLVDGTGTVVQRLTGEQNPEFVGSKLAELAQGP